MSSPHGFNGYRFACRYRATHATPALHSWGFDMNLSRSRQITLSRFNR